jgi:hypothetical protein
MESNKVKPVKVTAKDWERMRDVLLKRNAGASKTIKNADKAIARFAIGCVLCAVHKITEYNQYACYPFKNERDSVLDNINGLGIYSKYRFDDYIVPFGRTAMELGATIEQINVTIDTIWPTFRKEFDMAVNLYNKQKAAEAEAARLAKEEAERKEAERMEKLRACTKESEFISLTKYDLSKEEALIWVEKFGKKKKNQSNYRYTNTWHTWQGRIGCTHAELQKWSEAKQEWKKTESEPNWRPLAICRGYTCGVPSWMGGDFSYVTVVQDWRDLNKSRSDYDDETFTIYKHPHQ